EYANLESSSFKQLVDNWPSNVTGCSSNSDDFDGGHLEKYSATSDPIESPVRILTNWVSLTDHDRATRAYASDTRSTPTLHTAIALFRRP
ncbi:hypothetical protein RHS02_06517, partial [Rhizoctonia solani]